MALSDFSQEFQLEKRNLYTVICINQKRMWDREQNQLPDIPDD